MSITYEAIRQEVYRLTGIGYGPHHGVYAADSGTTTTVTIGELANSVLASTSVEGLWVLQPDDATAADREKPVASISTAGALTIAGTNWTAPEANDQIEVVYYLSLTEIFNTITETLKQLPQTVLLPLGAFADSDMETAGVSDWTASNSSLSKVTAAANVYSGRQALFINLTGANGYAESPAVRVNPDKSIFVAAIVRADAGTASLVLNDNTNGETFGTAPTHTGERWGVLWRHETVPSGCEEITVRIAGSGASDDIYCDSVAGPYVLNADFNIELPSWVDEPFRLKKIRQAWFHHTIGDHLLDAESRTFTDWALGKEIAANMIHGDVHPYKLQLRRYPPAAMLWVEGVRRAYDMTSTTFANTAAGEAYTTDLPREQVTLACAVAVCDAILAKPNVYAPNIEVVKRRLERRYAAWLRSTPPELPEQRSESLPMYGAV